jgi:hypothetical protein
VSADWRLIDLRTDRVMAIRDVHETVDRVWVDILAESGVAE